MSHIARLNLEDKSVLQGLRVTNLLLRFKTCCSQHREDVTLSRRHGHELWCNSLHSSGRRLTALITLLLMNPFDPQEVDA